MNSIQTRKWIRSALTALALGVAAATGVMAQSKPVVRVLVGFPPGSGSDSLARIYADALAHAMEVTTVVDSRPGAGGLIAAQALKAASPDSNTIMITADHQAVMLPLITKNPGFDVKKDMIPVARLANFYTCLVVPATSPAKSLDAYLENARKNSGMASVAIPAPGSQAHFLTYVMAQRSKAALTAVPYKGWAPAVVDLMGGNIPAGVGPCDAVTEHKRTGKLNILAVASDKRLKSIPDVPTFAENGYKMPVDNFLAVYASSTLKPELLKQMTEATRKMFDNPALVEKIAGTMMEPAYAGPDELRRIVDQNAEFWGEQVRRSAFQAQ